MMQNCLICNIKIFKCNELFSASTFKIMMYRNYDSLDNIGNIYKKLVFELIIWALNITIKLH